MKTHSHTTGEPRAREDRIPRAATQRTSCHCCPEKPSCGGGVRSRPARMLPTEMSTEPVCRTRKDVAKAAAIPANDPATLIPAVPHTHSHMSVPPTARCRRAVLDETTVLAVTAAALEDKSTARAAASPSTMRVTHDARQPAAFDPGTRAHRTSGSVSDDVARRISARSTRSSTCSGGRHGRRGAGRRADDVNGHKVRRADGCTRDVCFNHRHSATEHGRVVQLPHTRHEQGCSSAPPASPNVILSSALATDRRAGGAEGAATLDAADSTSVAAPRAPPPGTSAILSNIVGFTQRLHRGTAQEHRGSSRAHRAGPTAQVHGRSGRRRALRVLWTCGVATWALATLAVMVQRQCTTRRPRRRAHQHHTSASHETRARAALSVCLSCPWCDCAAQESCRGVVQHTRTFAVPACAADERHQPRRRRRQHHGAVSAAIPRGVQPVLGR
jgi:hypothetical protein